jgi:hypothetical protein
VVVHEAVLFFCRRLGGIAMHAYNHALTVLLGVADIDIAQFKCGVLGSYLCITNASLRCNQASLAWCLGMHTYTFSSVCEHMNSQANFV